MSGHISGSWWQHGHPGPKKTWKQKCAMKAVTGIKSQTYEECLVELKLPNLRGAARWTWYKPINCWTVRAAIFVRADIRRETRATAGTGNLLKKGAFISNFFSTRVIVEWNRLPNEVKEAGTAKNFKRLYTVWALWRPPEMADIDASTGEHVTEQQHRHQGPMQTADDQQTSTSKWE